MTTTPDPRPLVLMGTDTGALKGPSCDTEDVPNPTGKATASAAVGFPSNSAPLIPESDVYSVAVVDAAAQDSL